MNDKRHHKNDKHMKKNTSEGLISGTGVALVTPFTAKGNIDFRALDLLIEDIIINKVDFIVALGTTSEAATLTEGEKQKLMAFVIKSVNGRVPVVMGIGGNNTQSVINTIRETDFDGITAILSVAPYYNKPNQKGIYEHFSAIAKACPVDIILYNVPGRTSSNIEPATILELAGNHWNIVAVKEASGNLQQVMGIIQNRPEGFMVLSGDDALTFPLMALGADGVISVVANVYPAAFSGMVRYIQKEKYEEARSIHYSLRPFINLLFADGNPAGVKAALSINGMCKNVLRLPMVKVNPDVYKKIKQFLKSYEYPL